MNEQQSAVAAYYSKEMERIAYHFIKANECMKILLDFDYESDNVKKVIIDMSENSIQISKYIIDISKNLDELVRLL